MNKLLLIAACLLLVLDAAAPAAAADVQARTNAETFEDDGGQLTIRVDAAILLDLEQEPLWSRDDVLLDWMRAGGVSPQPFRITIPAGCFVHDGYDWHVRGTGCGVSVTLDGLPLAAEAFAARLVPPEPIRLHVTLELTLAVADGPALFSTLGGATFVAEVGSESGTSLPKRTESLYSGTLSGKRLVP